MNAVIPIGKEYLCQSFKSVNCKKIGRMLINPTTLAWCADGLCKTDINLQPNQIVCPIGQILCPDLTCRDSPEECYYDWPECESTQIRCSRQSCANDQNNCPTTITCANPNDVVCPDGTCVENEIYCSKPINCPEENPYLCPDNSCSSEPARYKRFLSCGHSKSLCDDLVCKNSC